MMDKNLNFFLIFAHLIIYASCSRSLSSHLKVIKVRPRPQQAMLTGKSDQYLLYSSNDLCHPQTYLFKLVQNASLQNSVKLKIAPQDYEMAKSLCHFPDLTAVTNIDTEMPEQRGELKQLSPWKCQKGLCSTTYRPGPGVHNSASVKFNFELSFGQEKKFMVIPIYFRDSAKYFPKEIQGERNQDISFELREGADFLLAGPSSLSAEEPLVITKVSGGRVQATTPCSYPKVSCQWKFIPQRDLFGPQVGTIHYNIKHLPSTSQTQAEQTQGEIRVSITDRDTPPESIPSQLSILPQQNVLSLMLNKHYRDLEGDPAKEIIVRSIQGGSVGPWQCHPEGVCQAAFSIQPGFKRMHFSFKVLSAKGLESNFSPVVLEKKGVTYKVVRTRILRGTKSSVIVSSFQNFQIAQDELLPSANPIEIIESQGIKSVDKISCQSLSTTSGAPSCMVTFTPDPSLTGTGKAWIKYALRTKNLPLSYYMEKKIFGTLIFDIADSNTPPDGRSVSKSFLFNRPSPLTLKLGEDYIDREGDPAFKIQVTNLQGGELDPWICHQENGTCTTLFHPHRNAIKGHFEYRIQPRSGAMEKNGSLVQLKAQVIVSE